MVDYNAFNLEPEEVTKYKFQRINLSKRVFWENYEKVRVVGKGAYGTAILYRRNDQKLVVMKEIDIHEMNVNERNLSINEIKVLSILDHPHIVSFFNNYEWEGKLLIEMEYCEGGNLADFLSQLDQPLKEFEILTIFEQIVSAITYIHDRNILHRDLKTANIFMTKDKIFKVGDFGICKILSTQKLGASTVVGTPHYISPEMCEGKNYDKKADIWSLGCILYEMACLHKTFEGTSLPALINKIVKGKYAPVKRNYSIGFQKLITEMLQKDPDLRPHAHEIQSEVSDLLVKTRYGRLGRHDQEKFSNDLSTEAVLAAQFLNRFLKQPRSLLYEIHLKTPHISLSKIEVVPTIRIKELSKSSNHFLAVTYDYHVYAWGACGNGQLGLGKTSSHYINKPTLVDELCGKDVLKCAAGEGFSIFVSKNGLALSCGSYHSHCLANDTEDDCIIPTVINKLLGCNICEVVCGPQHVITVTDEGQVFNWGCNLYGQLGIFDEPHTVTSPKKVIFPENIFIIKAYTSVNASVFIDSKDGLWVCGSNEFNKLGLSQNTMLKKVQMSCVRTPQKLKWINEKPTSVVISSKQTLILTESGYIAILGSSGLNRSNLVLYQRASDLYSFVKLTNNTITKIQCGNSFCLAQTLSNHIYFWGVREIESKSEYTIAGPSGENQIKEESSAYDLSDVIKIGETNLPLMKILEQIGPDYPIILVQDPKVIIDNLNDLSILTKSLEDKKRVTISKPQPIISVFASLTNLQFGETVELVNLFCFLDDKVYMLLETTIPLTQVASVNNVYIVDNKKPKAKNLNTASNLPVVKEEGFSTKSVSDKFQWESDAPSKEKVFSCWTIPSNRKELTQYINYRTLQNKMEELKDQLDDNHFKLNIYGDQIQELQEELMVIRKKTKEKSRFKFCVII